MMTDTTDTGLWVTVEEAAQLARVSARTIQRWIERGHVVSDVTDDGRRRVRRESLPPACLLSDRNVRNCAHLADTTDTTTDTTDKTDSDVADSADGRTRSTSTHELSEPAATARECDLLRDQVEFLTRQADARTVEAHELRVLLGQQQALLADVLQQRALPPAPRRRWWPWRKRTGV